MRTFLCLVTSTGLDDGTFVMNAGTLDAFLFAVSTFAACNVGGCRAFRFVGASCVGSSFVYVSSLCLDAARFDDRAFAIDASPFSATRRAVTRTVFAIFGGGTLGCFGTPFLRGGSQRRAYHNAQQY